MLPNCRIYFNRNGMEELQVHPAAAHMHLLHNAHAAAADPPRMPAHVLLDWACRPAALCAAVLATFVRWQQALPAVGAGARRLRLW